MLGGTLNFAITRSEACGSPEHVQRPCKKALEKRKKTAATQAIVRIAYVVEYMVWVARPACCKPYEGKKGNRVNDVTNPMHKRSP